MFHGTGGLRRVLAEAAPARSGPAAGARDAAWKVQALELEVERLLMITEALWAILKEKHGLADEELADRVMEIDLRDGKLDGQVARSGPAQCPYCGRPTITKRPLCLYCGKALQPDLFGR